MAGRVFRRRLDFIRHDCNHEYLTSQQIIEPARNQPGPWKSRIAADMIGVRECAGDSFDCTRRQFRMPAENMLQPFRGEFHVARKVGAREAVHETLSTIASC